MQQELKAHCRRESFSSRDPQLFERLEQVVRPRPEHRVGQHVDDGRSHAKPLQHEDDRDRGAQAPGGALCERYASSTSRQRDDTANNLALFAGSTSFNTKHISVPLCEAWTNVTTVAPLGADTELRSRCRDPTARRRISPG
jgi:hypothetical protein